MGKYPFDFVFLIIATLFAVPKPSKTTIMKRIITCMLALGLAANVLQASDISFFLDIYRFQTLQGTESYAEIFLSVDGTSVSYRPTASGMFQAEAYVDIRLLKVGDRDSVIVFADKYKLKSPEIQDTTLASRKLSFLNVHRLGVQPGDYYIRVLVEDAYRENGRKIMATNEFNVEAPTNAECKFSDVVFVQSMYQDKTEEAKQNPLYKHGYITRPMVSNGAFINADTLFFYVELYNADKLIKESTFYLRARIKQGEKILYAYETVASRKRAQPFNIDFDIIDIRELPSQTYYLQIDVLTEQNQIVKSTSKKFHVFNSRVEPEFDDYVAINLESALFGKYSEAELDYYLNTLVHTSTEQEIRFRKALENYEQKKNYLYTYWEKRKNPDQRVADLWGWHLSALQYSNQHFKSALREGWQTDRGRVFLEHGIPSDVERFPSSSTSVPYEIWRYDRLGNQTNVIFVFFNPDVTTEEYPLLHSSKYGEMNNPGWKRQLLERGHVPSSIDYENDNFNIPGTELNRNK